MNAIQIHPRDNVAVALSPLKKDTVVLGVALMEDIPQGHKFALADIAPDAAMSIRTMSKPICRKKRLIPISRRRFLFLLRTSPPLRFPDTAVQTAFAGSVMRFGSFPLSAVSIPLHKSLRIWPHRKQETV